MVAIRDLINAMKDEDGNIDGNKITNMVMSVIKNRPGFFSPFRSLADFGFTLTTPISGPLLFTFLTGVCAFGLAVAAITCMGSLLFAAASAPFDSEIASSSLIIGLLAGGVSIACIICTGLFAVAAILASPYFGLSLAARSISTLGKALCGVPVDEEEPVDMAFQM
ncbi:MAG: hypothetical protein H0U57_01095 [Tatlockia sp.]|nr:hypothetical protein [Tatlockia sp.]